MIRKFQDGDLDAVMQLWLCGNLDAHAFIPEAYWRLNYEAVRDSILQAEIYVYEAEGRICAFVGMTDNYLAGIFVEKTSRSCGIGKFLLDYIKNLFPAFTLHVYEENRRAVEFYLREGLIVLSRETESDTGCKELTMAWKCRQ